MATEQRLAKQLAFSLEMDKAKNVFRQTHLSGGGRAENDAEHSWHMALMAYLLREHANEKIDVLKVVIMCLLHDVVEIDAGDTYAYDKDAIETQNERENRAKERIFSLLPSDQKAEFIALFEEFEAGQTAEAKFARAVDNLQPLLLNDDNNGADWKAHGVSEKQVRNRQKKTELGSKALYAVTEKIIQKNVDNGNLKSLETAL